MVLNSWAYCAPVEAQWGKTVKPVFRLQLGPDPEFRIFDGTSVILRSSPIRGYPYHVCRCPGSAVIKQNGRERDFPVFSGFPVPDPEFPGSVHPGVILGSARTQRYPTCGHRGSGSLNSYLPQRNVIQIRKSAFTVFQQFFQKLKIFIGLINRSQVYHLNWRAIFLICV